MSFWNDVWVKGFRDFYWSLNIKTSRLCIRCKYMFMGVDIMIFISVLL